MNAAQVAARLDGRLLEVWSRPAGPGAIRASGAGTAVQTDHSGGMRVLSLEDGRLLAEDRLEPREDTLALPAFDADGDIRVVSGRSVRAYDREGRLQWSRDVGDGLNRALAVTPDGTSYVQGQKELHALAEDGQVLWSRPLEPRSSWDAPAVTPDGTVVSVSADGALVAFTPDGDEAWRNEDRVRQDRFDLCPVRTPLEVGPDGSLHFLGLDRKLHVVGSDGQEKWTREVGGDPIDYTAPQVDGEGNVYLSRGYDLLGFDAQGREIFTRTFPSSPYPQAAPDAGVAVWLPGQGLATLDPQGRDEGRISDDDSGHVAFVGPDDLLWKTGDRLARVLAPEASEAWIAAHPAPEVTVEQQGQWLTIGSVRLEVQAG